MSLEAANREVYLLLKEGIKVSVPDRQRGSQKTERLRMMDWEQGRPCSFIRISSRQTFGAVRQAAGMDKPLIWNFGPSLMTEFFGILSGVPAGF
jgi:hypothetical protein